MEITRVTRHAKERLKQRYRNEILCVDTFIKKAVLLGLTAKNLPLSVVEFYKKKVYYKEKILIFDNLVFIIEGSKVITIYNLDKSLINIVARAKEEMAKSKVKSIVQKEKKNQTRSS